MIPMLKVIALRTSFFPFPKTGFQALMLRSVPEEELWFICLPAWELCGQSMK